MNKKHLFQTNLLLIVLICGLISAKAQSKLSIIPQPKFVEEHTGGFEVSAKTIIYYKNSHLKKLAELMRSAITEANGIKPQIQQALTTTIKPHSITLKLDTSVKTGAEGYVLDISPTAIVLKANKEAGLFYGIQTLIQLMPQKQSDKILAVHIEDEPRFAWRGMMFDNCRHFFSVDFIKRFIDQLAYHKLNKFHWHLTDDQGWRIEIKRYPKLQQVAAWRNGTQTGRNRQKDVDSIRYGGYYTQQQIKDVVAYATARYVEVIPEIEMPGHSVAAITAYPELGCTPMSFETGKPHEVRKVWGVSKDLYCAGNDSVFVFLQNVLTEVMQLFPSKYIHIGGDEAPHDAWKVCPKCQKRMQDEHLANTEELQSWFIRRMEKFINSKGKRLIGWEEIMQGGLTPTATVQSWLGVQSGLKASQMGNDVIMSPYSHLYFDGYQASSKIEPLAIGYFTPLDTVYAFEPRHPQMTDADAKHLLGAQANLWTEFISTPEYFEYMVFPRIDALAEITWTPRDKKNFDDFQLRLQNQFKRYDKQKINYRIPVPALKTTTTADSSTVINLTNRSGSGLVRYEINNGNVTTASPVYTNEIPLKKGDTIYFANFPDNGRKSSTDYFPKAVKKKN
jgi:hexosaminidase